MEDLGLVGGARRQKMHQIMEQNNKLLSEARERGEDTRNVKLIPLPDDITYAKEITSGTPATREQVMSRFYDEMIAKPHYEPTGDKKVDEAASAKLLREAKNKFVADAVAGSTDMPVGETTPPSGLGKGYFHANEDDVVNDLEHGGLIID